MKERYSFMVRVTYENGSESEKTFDTVEEAREYVDDLDDNGIVPMAGWELFLIDWYWRNDVRIDSQWFD